MKREAWIMILIVAVVVIGGIVLINVGNQAQLAPVKNAEALARGHSARIGSTEAKVTVVEFGDFQCPACLAAEPIVQQVLERYKDNPQFSFVYRNFPLASIHKNAMLAAEVSLAAKAHGKFWEMHDAFFVTQDEWATSDNSIDLFLGYAGELGLDVNKIRASVEAHEFLSEIEADLADGETLGVPGTPTFFINDMRQQSTPSFTDFVQLIETELSK